MRSELVIPRRLAQLKLGLLSATPIAAYAADQVLRQAGLQGIPAWTWFFVWLFATGGWAIAHLDTLVEWFAPNTAPAWAERVALWKARLHIVQNYIASVSAGCAFYFLAVSVPSWFGLAFNVPELVVIVGVTPAAMGGTATWEKIRRRFIPDDK